jgi:hypothetical protein
MGQLENLKEINIAKLNNKRIPFHSGPKAVSFDQVLPSGFYE